MIEVVVKRAGREFGRFIITEMNDVLVLDHGLEIVLGGGAEASLAGTT